MHQSNIKFQERIDRARDEDFLKTLELNLLNDLSLQGIEAITKVYMHKPKTDDKKKVTINAEGEYKTTEEWILETDGTALLHV